MGPIISQCGLSGPVVVCHAGTVVYNGNQGRDVNRTLSFIFINGIFLMKFGKTLGLHQKEILNNGNKAQALQIDFGENVKFASCIH